jgi:hypothetical protein
MYTFSSRVSVAIVNLDRYYTKLVGKKKKWRKYAENKKNRSRERGAGSGTGIAREREREKGRNK